MKYWQIGIWVFLLIMSIFMWLNQQEKNWQQDERIMRNSALLTELQDLRIRSSDRWTGTDTENFLVELIRLNPGLKIPDEKFWKGKSRK